MRIRANILNRSCLHLCFSRTMRWCQKYKPIRTTPLPTQVGSQRQLARPMTLSYRAMAYLHLTINRNSPTYLLNEMISGDSLDVGPGSNISRKQSDRTGALDESSGKISHRLGQERLVGVKAELEAVACKTEEHFRIYRFIDLWLTKDTVQPILTKRHGSTEIGKMQLGKPRPGQQILAQRRRFYFYVLLLSTSPGFQSYSQLY